VKQPAILFLIAVLFSTSSLPIHAQAKRSRITKPVSRTQPADMTCPAPLGTGVKTGRLFCDVLAGRDPQAGIIVKLPKRQGPAVLTFDLHNRQTYSAEEERSGHAYTRYTATIGVLTLDNTLLSRFVVQNEFRRASDLFDRILGGSGPGGVKAVAPTGLESVVLEIPAKIDAVSILGEKLETKRLDGDALYTAPGRPVAVISNVIVEYRPAPQPTRRRR
jgi:hypothetical protein